MIEVKTPINPIISEGDNGLELQEQKEHGDMLDNYFIDNNVGVHI